jgi:DNA repair exonuclease SbcCD nuclease subunit
MSSGTKKKRSRKTNETTNRKSLPTVQNADNVIAICCADIHLSLKAPVWRSAEEDWMEAMKRPLLELQKLQEKYDCPVICAGDIFDRWNSPPELINFAMDHIPDEIYAIPGQHDLPLHNYNEIHRSAFWTLLGASRIQGLNRVSNRHQGVMRLRGVPFGFELLPIEESDDYLNIAVVHKYIWIPGHSYPQAPVTNRLSKKKIPKGYDVIIYGDNHKGFLTEVNGTTIFNCGTLMRRKSDEVDYEPHVGLLLDTGEIKIHYLDTSQDKYLENLDNKKEDEEIDMSSFIKELEKLGATDLDFEDAIIQYMKSKKVNPKVKEIILKSME